MGRRTRHGGGRRLKLLMLLLGVTAASCDSDDGGLANRVLATIPAYTPSAADSGPLDRNAASQSLPASPAQTGAALDAAGFRTGYSRIFLRGGAPSGDYVLLAAYQMAGSGGGKSFLAAERRALQGTGTVALFSAQGLPDSLGFILTGSTKRGDREVFCDGVAFAKGATVYAVTACSATPLDTSLAVEVAKRQAAVG